MLYLIEKWQKIIRKIEINGFKFLYELLALSKGVLIVNEIPLTFKERKFGNSKLDIAIIWTFLSIIHNLTLRFLPRRAISFGLWYLVSFFNFYYFISKNIFIWFL